jgi:hypothetical protein
VNRREFITLLGGAAVARPLKQKRDRSRSDSVRAQAEWWINRDCYPDG